MLPRVQSTCMLPSATCNAASHSYTLALCAFPAMRPFLSLPPAVWRGAGGQSGAELKRADASDKAAETLAKFALGGSTPCPGRCRAPGPEISRAPRVTDGCWSVQHPTAPRSSTTTGMFGRSGLLMCCPPRGWCPFADKCALPSPVRRQRRLPRYRSAIDIKRDHRTVSELFSTTILIPRCNNLRLHLNSPVPALKSRINRVQSRYARCLSAVQSRDTSATSFNPLFTATLTTHRCL